MALTFYFPGINKEKILSTGKETPMKFIKWLPVTLLLIPLTATASPSFTVLKKMSAVISDNRIFAFEYTGNPSSKDIAKYVFANKPKHKEGYLTAAYFFPEGSGMPQSNFKNVMSMYVANEYLYNSPEIDPWQFAVIIHFNKKGFIVNCSKTPLDDYCRKSRKAAVK